MVSVTYANAMAETLYYLKGIRQEDIDKIPKKFMEFLEENASKDYECNFDYTKPLKELNLRDETKGIIGAICLNFLCSSDEQKKMLLDKLKINEQNYQEELREKYNPDNIFKNDKTEIAKPVPNEMALKPVEKQSILERIFSKIKSVFKKK